MCDQPKKGSNTVEQLIGNMTADVQNADGQYIQLGFTPPPPSTGSDQHIWSEYTNPNPIAQNPFVPHYSPRNSNRNSNRNPDNRYVSPNVSSYNNYIAQNQMYVPEMSNNAYEKHLNGHGGKILFCPAGQSQQYLVQNQADLAMPMPMPMTMPMYMQCYPENRDRMFVSPDLTNHGTDPMLFAENVLMQQQNQHKLLMQPPQNRTPLIENLMTNWTPNQNGTYSPFGNVPTQNPQNYFLKADAAPQQIPPQIIPESINCEYTPKSFPISNKPPTFRKHKQIAEVKPMRPTYSDVLAKSVPAQTPPKPDKIDPKPKTAGKKSAKTDKFPKIALNRQMLSNSPDALVNGLKYADKQQSESDPKVNLSRKWVSLDDVNEVNQSADFLKSDENGGKMKKIHRKLEGNGANGSKHENAPTVGKNPVKKTFHDNNSLGCQWTESEDFNENSKNDEKNINKNPNKKAKEIRSNSGRQNRFDRSSSEKPIGSAKRSQRIRRKDNYSSFGSFGQTVQHYVSRWSKVIFAFVMWLFHLISDIFMMSLHLGRDLSKLVLESILVNSKLFSHNTMTILKRVKIFTKIANYVDKTFGETRWAFWNRGEKERKNNSKHVDGQKFLNSGLEHNISMPTTGEEAMKRLLACKGKDPYSILGVRPDCTDDDIKRYYKRQAFLVHPDKNPQPGAEEAFKILVHAFDIIGEPERRQSYDRKVAESHQVEQAWSELNDLLSQLHQKMEYAANTIRCTNCTKRHRRIAVDRPCYAARMCQQCRIHHSAKEGDIWAEATYFGFLWHYYACMDGAVYDITEWAGCQRKNLKHLRPNSHNVQYRIVLGKQGGQSGGNGAAGSAAGASHGRRHGKNGSGGSTSDREADLESFLNNLYSQSDLSAAAGATPPAQETGGASAARLRKKNKRKK